MAILANNLVGPMPRDASVQEFPLEFALGSAVDPLFLVLALPIPTPTAAGRGHQPVELPGLAKSVPPGLVVLVVGTPSLVSVLGTA